MKLHETLESPLEEVEYPRDIGALYETIENDLTWDLDGTSDESAHAENLRQLQSYLPIENDDERVLFVGKVFLEYLRHILEEDTKKREASGELTVDINVGKMLSYEFFHKTREHLTAALQESSGIALERDLDPQSKKEHIQGTLQEFWHWSPSYTLFAEGITDSPEKQFRYLRFIGIISKFWGMLKEQTT